MERDPPVSAPSAGRQAAPQNAAATARIWGEATSARIIFGDAVHDKPLINAGRIASLSIGMTGTRAAARQALSPVVLICGAPQRPTKRLAVYKLGARPVD